MSVRGVGEEGDTAAWRVGRVVRRGRLSGGGFADEWPGGCGLGLGLGWAATRVRPPADRTSGQRSIRDRGDIFDLGFMMRQVTARGTVMP